MRYLYHWTPRINVRSIMREGLDPVYSTGRQRRVWLAGYRRAQWACSHAAARHRVSPDEMVLLRVDVTRLKLTRTCWSDVRTSASVIDPARITQMVAMYVPAARAKGRTK